MTDDITFKGLSPFRKSSSSGGASIDTIRILHSQNSLSMYQPSLYTLFRAPTFTHVVALHL